MSTPREQRILERAHSIYSKTVRFITLLRSDRRALVREPAPPPTSRARPTGQTDSLANYYQAEKEITEEENNKEENNEEENNKEENNEEENNEEENNEEENQETSRAIDLCVACTDREVAVRFHPCRHECLCQVCFQQLFTLSPEKKVLCPICRSMIRRFSGQITWPDLITDLLPPQESRDNYYQQLKNYLKLVVKTYTKINEREFLQNMEIIHKSERQSDKLLLLSTTQTEDLLSLFNSFQKTSFIEKIFVLNCFSPWSVAIPLGNSGVCYYGNLGDTPTLDHAVRLIYRNYGYLYKSLVIGRKAFT